jgi:hypothetical protein
LQNNGVDPLNWTAGRSDGWISFSSSSGTLGPGQSTSVTVFLNALPLDFAVGSFSATASFVNTSTGDIVSRPVNLQITLPGSASVTTPTLIASNQLQLRLSGSIGDTFVIEEASSITGPWSPLYTDIFVSSVASYTITLNGARRFFRAQISGPGMTPGVFSFAQLTGQDLSQVIITGNPFGTYVLESSPNGTTWTPVSTNKLPASGNVTLGGANASLQYRATAIGAFPTPTLDHILILGESLAAGFDGAPALSTIPSLKHYRFVSDSSSTNLLNLYELGTETIASSLGGQLSLSAPGRRILVSNNGSPGAGYAAQQKGTALYNRAISMVEAAPQTVACSLYSYHPRAIVVLGGESDGGSTAYDLSMRQWQSDYQKDIQRVTGYPDSIPMLHSQISAWTSPAGGGGATTKANYGLLLESETNPTKTILVGPRYFLPHAGASANYPGLHLSNTGYRWLGEYYAKVYKQVIVDGGSWTPLKPNTASRVANVITVTFSVPVPPLSLDTAAVSNPGNNGFEYTDDSGSPPSITNVQVTGNTTVQITLSATPTGTNKRVRYAFTGIPGAYGGPTTGPRGNLRDSDATPSAYGNGPLYNWCVHFDKDVN